MWLEHVDLISQLLMLKETGNISLSTIKIIDDFLMTGKYNFLRKKVIYFSNCFKLDETVHSSGVLHFFGMNIAHNDDFIASINADDNLSAIEPYPICRAYRRLIDERMNDIKRRTFNSINASIEWFGTTASYLCLFYWSCLQQRISSGWLPALLS